MCLYEVELQIEEPLVEEYRVWLGEHVADMLKIEGFVRAEIFRCVDPSSPPGFQTFVVHYYLRNERDLKTYFKTAAPRMRDQGLQRFGSRFRATRRVLLTCESS